jgi:hypothetical protein
MRSVETYCIVSICHTDGDRGCVGSNMFFPFAYLGTAGSSSTALIIRSSPVAVGATADKGGKVWMHQDVATALAIRVWRGMIPPTSAGHTSVGVNAWIMHQKG